MVKHRTFKIIWDVNALNDFVEILEFLSKKGNQAPRIVKQGILTRLEVIRKNAFICETDKLKDTQDREFRAFVVYSYRITYQIKSSLNEIRVIRVRHTSREPLGY